MGKIFKKKSTDNKIIKNGAHYMLFVQKHFHEMDVTPQYICFVQPVT